MTQRNPLLLRTGHQRGASSGVVMARRRTVRYAGSNSTQLRGYKWLH